MEFCTLVLLYLLVCFRVNCHFFNCLLVPGFNDGFVGCSLVVIVMEPRIKRHKVASNDFNGLQDVTDLSINTFSGQNSFRHLPYKNDHVPVTSTTTIDDLHPELLSIIFLYLILKVQSNWCFKTLLKQIYCQVKAEGPSTGN